MIRISGFGQDGPFANRACFDVIAQAMGGIMNMTGQENGPPTMAGTFVVDYATALYGTIGALAALHARHTSGKGQLVEATLLETAASLLVSAIPDFSQLGLASNRMGNRDRYASPVNSFRCADGHWVYLSAGTDALFRRFADATGSNHLLTDPRFDTADARLQHQDDIEAEVGSWVRQHTADDVVAFMEQAGVPCAKVATIEDVVNNPQLAYRNQIVDLDHPGVGTYTTHGITVTLHDTPGRIARPAPRLGEHTQEILNDWLPELVAET